jgi:hypothetical protein
MRKYLPWLVIAVLVIVIAAGAGIVALHFEKNLRKPLAVGGGVPGMKDGAPKIPTGRQTYNISQASGTLPVISQVTIDPVLIGVGGIQKFLVVTRNDPKDPVISMEARTVTDHGTSTVLLTPTTTTSTVPGVQAFAGQWKVHDTHTAKYETSFFAKDTKGNQNLVTLGWMDPTCDPNEDEGGGTYIFSSCSLSLSGDQVQEGNILINGNVIMNPPATLVFSPGYQINFGPGASLAIVYGSSITTTNSTGALLPVTPPPISIYFDGLGAYGMIYPQSPTTQDFKVQFCINNTGGNIACETSPWASQEVANTGQWIDTSSGDGTYYVSPGTSSLGTGGWSGWDWPGGNDQLSANDYSATIVATQPLPAGEALTNLQLAIELAENNNAYNQGYIGSNYNLSNETLGCKISYSPVAGGLGTEVYSYTYDNSCPGTGSAASTPDIFRVSMLGSLVALGSLRSATLSASGIPASITHGTSASGATINVTNNGPMAFVSNSQTFTASGAGTGDCYTDTDGDGYADAPNHADSQWDGDDGDVPASVSCQISGTLKANDIQLSHSGSFAESTPAYMAASDTKTTTYRAPYTTEVGAGCNGGGTLMNNVKNPFAFIINAIAKAYAAGTGDLLAMVSGGCTIHAWPAINTQTNSASLGIAVNGNYTFALPTMTAPSSPGTYTEKWTVTDGNSKSLGKITNGSYSKAITVN